MNEEYISCDLIEYGFDLQINSIDLCCRISGEHLNKKFSIVKNFSGQKIDWDMFFRRKRYLRDIQKKGEVFAPCSGCLYLRKEKWDDGNYITTVNINNWIKCNADCIYCDRSLYSNMKEYNVLPIFKDMIKKNILRKGGPITISGGEPTVIREFEPLLKLFIKNDFDRIKVLTNAIKYSKTIEKGLKLGSVCIVVSTDSGTKEMYKTVKHTDKYSVVWKNLNKYAKKASSLELVKTKFIIIPEINDTLDEIYQFIEQNYTNGLKFLELDLEIAWFYRNRNSEALMMNVYNLFLAAKNKCEEKGLFLEPKDRMLLVIKMLNK